MTKLERLAERIKEIKAARPSITFNRFLCGPEAYRLLKEDITTATAVQINGEFTYQGVPVVKNEYPAYNEKRTIKIELEEDLYI